MTARQSVYSHYRFAIKSIALCLFQCYARLHEMWYYLVPAAVLWCCLHHILVDDIRVSLAAFPLTCYIRAIDDYFFFPYIQYC